MAGLPLFGLHFLDTFAFSLLLSGALAMVYFSTRLLAQSCSWVSAISEDTSFLTWAWPACGTRGRPVLVGEDLGSNGHCLQSLCGHVRSLRPEIHHAKERGRGRSPLSELVLVLFSYWWSGDPLASWLL